MPHRAEPLFTPSTATRLELHQDALTGVVSPNRLNSVEKSLRVVVSDGSRKARHIEASRPQPHGILFTHDVRIYPTDDSIA